MKITKTKGQADHDKLMKERANAGCDRCPSCGHGNNYNIPPTIRIAHTGTRTFNKGIIHRETYYVDCYRCLECGTEWESEPYRKCRRFKK